MAIHELIQNLKDNPNDGNLYISLGDICINEDNVNQAYICYENACQYLTEEGKRTASVKMENCKSSPDFCVHPASFVILSYNSKDIMQECLNAIRSTCVTGSYEVIVVDSGSTDGIREWLSEQEDITLILNDKFGGFSAGCNQGAKLAKPDNDIFLLNNDAILTPRAFFYMRLALYSDIKAGAVGPVSSNVSEEQLFDSSKRTHDEWLTLASAINHPSLNPTQSAHWLQGHALLIKRSVWDYAGMMDEGFQFAGYEDFEYGVRLNLLGYKLSICKNAFIYHYGSTSMKTVGSIYSKAQVKNRLLFKEKYGFSLDLMNESIYYGGLSLITEDTSTPLNVLMIYGGCSNFLNLIKYKYPNSNIYAVEQDPAFAKISSNYANTYCINIEENNLCFDREYFDYIFLCRVELCDDLKCVIENLKTYIKPNGHLVLHGKNANHISVIDSLIHGSFDSPLLKESKHSYTTDDLCTIITSCQLKIPKLTWIYSSPLADLNESQQRTLEALLSLSQSKDRNTYIHTSVRIDTQK